MSGQKNANPAEIYEAFLVPGIHARWTPIFLERAEPRRGERVLDLACGTGIVARRVAPKVGPEGSVVAVDVSPDMLAVASDLPAPAGAPIKWEQGDAESLSHPDGAFDLGLCQQGLQFVSDRKAALREMRRVLASDGRAVASVWQGLDRHPVYEALCEAEAEYLDVPVSTLATPFTMEDAADLRKRFEDAGFSRVDIEPASHRVRFTEPDRFVALTVLAAASIIPKSEMDDDAREDLVRTVSRDVDPTLRRFRDNGSIAFPMHAHIAAASV